MAKKRFTWLDGLCIVLIAAVVIGAIWYLTRGDKLSGTEKEYEITMRFTQATNDPYDFYQVGDTMYLYTRSGVLGTITSLTSMDRIIEDYDRETGRYITYTDQRWKTIEMKVLARGTLSGGTFQVADEELSIGKTFYPQSDTTRSIMVIWDIEEVGE